MKFTGLALLVFGLMTTSCVSPQRLKQHINSKKVSLGHVDNANRTFENKKDTIYFSTPINVNSDLQSIAVVNKEISYCIPLLFYWNWKQQFGIALGKEQVEENIGEFLKKRITRDINYHTSHFADTVSSTGNLHLEVKIEKLEMQGKYNVDGFYAFLLFFYIIGEEHKPTGDAYSKLSYKLYKESELLLSGVVESKKPLTPVEGYYNSYKVFRQEYVRSFVEVFAETLKENSLKIASEIEANLKE